MREALKWIVRISSLPMTTIVDIPENQEQLQALLKRIQAGEELLLAQEGIPVARLSPAYPRIPGQDRGKVIIASDFNAPLPDNILDDFFNPA